MSDKEKELDQLDGDDDQDLDGDGDDDQDLDVDDDPGLDDDLGLDDESAEADDDESEDQVVEGEKVAKRRPRRRARKGSDDDDDVLELDEELHPDDIEDPLDVLLQERTAAASLEDDEEDAVEEIEIDDRAEGPTRIRPRREGEFLCGSCFLVLPRNQLADEKRMLCRDCA